MVLTSRCVCVCVCVCECECECMCVCVRLLNIVRTVMAKHTFCLRSEITCEDLVHGPHK